MVAGARAIAAQHERHMEIVDNIIVRQSKSCQTKVGR
jgi:hypothetical protein